MKRLSLLCFVTILMLAGPALPQARGQTAHNFRVAQDLINSYSARAAAGMGPDQSALVAIYVHDLEPTARNVSTVQRLLSMKRPIEDTVMLVRILGRLYTRDDRTRRNREIVRTLKGFIYSGNRDIGAAALLSYSRLPYQQDVVDVLSYGFATKLIEKDEYCRELALSLLPDAPPDGQFAAAKLLEKTDSQRSVEVLATILNSRDNVSRIAPAAKVIVYALMTNHDPVLPMALGQFGFFAATRYSSWLHSVALLAESTGTAPYDATVMRYLNDDKTDPRKILGFLSSNFGSQLMRDNGHRQPFEAAASRSFAFARQFPGHPGMSPMVREIKNTLSSLPE